MFLRLKTQLQNLPLATWAWMILLLLLSTILYSPLVGDDLPMFQYRVENPKIESQSIHELAQVMVDRFLPMGRLTVLSFYYVEWVFKTFTTPVTYKSWMVLLNVITIVIFLRWLKFIGFQFNTALLLICIATGVQLRLNYHDSYSSYTGLCQLFNSLIFISTASWLYIYRKFNVWMLVFALISTLSLFFISEYALMLLLLIPCILWLSDQLNYRRTSIKSLFLWTIPIGVISITYLYVIFYLRSIFPKDNLYSGLSSNIDFGAMVMLELKQIYASIPLSNLTNTPRIPLRLFNQFRFWDVFVATGLLFVALYHCRKIVSEFHNNSNLDNNNRVFDRKNVKPVRVNFVTEKKSQSRNSLILGTFLLVVTPVFILPSAKYQLEITWGNGYLSLMLQNLGFSLILYSLFEWLLVVKNKFLFWRPIFILLVLFTSITFLFNHSLSKKYWYKKSFPADVVWGFIKSKQLNELPNDAILVLEQDFYFKSAELYQELIRDHTGKRIHVLNFDDEVVNNIERILQNLKQLSLNNPIYQIEGTCSKQTVISKQNSQQSIIYLHWAQPSADSATRIFGLFVKNGKEIEIKLCPISLARLSKNELQAQGEVLSQLKKINPISVIPADLD